MPLCRGRLGVLVLPHVCDVVARAENQPPLYTPVPCSFPVLLLRLALATLLIRTAGGLQDHMGLLSVSLVPMPCVR